MMKKTALFIIAVFAIASAAPWAAAEDDILKKMRAFQDVMDTLPESTRTEEPEPESPEVTPPVAPEMEKTEEEVQREPYPWERETPKMEEEAEREAYPWERGAPKADKSVDTDQEEDKWTPYQGYTPDTDDMVEDVTAEPEMDMAEDESPEYEDDETDIDDDMADNEEDIEDEFIEEPDKDAVMESAAEDDDEADDSEMSSGAEESMEDVVEEAAETEEMPDSEFSETGMDDPVVEDTFEEESAYEWEEEPVLDEELKAEIEKAAERVATSLETDMPADIPEEAADVEESVRETAEAGIALMDDAVAQAEETTGEMNIAEADPVGEMESDLSAPGFKPLKESAALSIGRSQPSGLDEPEVLKYRQDLTQELTPEMIDRHAQIDRIKSEIDAEINEIQSDIELITGAKRNNPAPRTEE